MVVVVALRPLTPRGTLRAGRGLPSVIGTRGMMSAAFFCGQAYIVLVLQDRWGYSTGAAGLALTVVGVVWASMSQVQARLGDRVTSETAMRVGTGVLLVAVVGLWLTVRFDAPGVLAGAAFVVAGAGMGFGFSRTGVAMLAASTDHDRGFNSSALSIADSISAAAGAVGVRHRLRAGQRGRRRPVPDGLRRRDRVRGRRGRHRGPDPLSPA